MKSRLKKVVFMSKGFFCNIFIGNIILISVEGDNGEIYWMIHEFSSSAKLCVNISQVNWHFMHDIAESSFFCSLVFYMEVVPIVLYTGNPVTSPPLQIPFYRLLASEVYSVTDFKIRFSAVCCFFVHL